MPWLAQCEWCKKTAVVNSPYNILVHMRDGTGSFPYVTGASGAYGWYGQFSISYERYEFCCAKCAERSKELTWSGIDAWLAGEGDAP